MRYLKLLVVAVVFYGCGPTKYKESKVETVKKDTVYIETSGMQTRVLNAAITIEQLCDSVTGKPKDFSYVSNSGAAAASVEIKDNKLSFNINIDSIKAVAVKEYRDSFDSSLSNADSKTTKTKVPKWAWISLLGNIAAVLGAGFKWGKDFKFWDSIKTLFKFKK